MVNLPEPAVRYANWFSYRSADFASENREIYRAIRTTRALFPHARLRFVGDAGLDDQRLWVLVAHCPDFKRDLVLLTNVPICTPHDAETVYCQWRYRPYIEHIYRFDQEEGLDMEDVRVQTMERMRRVFALTLLAALFVYRIAHTWPRHMVLWLRCLCCSASLSLVTVQRKCHSLDSREVTLAVKEQKRLQVVAMIESCSSSWWCIWPAC